MWSVDPHGRRVRRAWIVDARGNITLRVKPPSPTYNPKTLKQTNTKERTGTKHADSER